MRSGKYAALIAVREGSSRIIDKNIKDFAGSSLLRIKIEQALSVNLVDEVIVSSDSDEMLFLAKSLGVNAIKRPDEFCTNYVEMKKVYRHLAESITCDHVVYLHVTSPLLKLDTLKLCIERYKSMGDEYDSLATVEDLKKYIWYRGKAINYDPSNHPRSQDLDKYYALNFAVNILPRPLMIAREAILGKKFYPYFLSDIESIDVDTPTEFQVAETMYQNILKKK